MRGPCLVLFGLLAGCSHQSGSPTVASDDAPRAAPPAVVPPAVVPPTGVATAVAPPPSCSGTLTAECGLAVTSDHPGSEAVELVHRPWPELTGRSPLLRRSMVVRIAVDATRLWVGIENCPMCAAGVVHHRRADVTQVTDEQLARLQLWLGKPASPLLRTAAAWRAAFGR
jgi:hypothetical protein